MSDERQIYVILPDGGFAQTTFDKLTKGTLFIMFEETGELVSDGKYSVCIALSDAYENEDSIGTIKCSLVEELATAFYMFRMNEKANGKDANDFYTFGVGDKANEQEA